ncbi:MAG: PadR family transcriptional regulator [Herpetosiphonaceae bacterium]|nr:PadR family transcriptional regulator [Herpetosiphonaceae bacterium]
MLKYVLLGGLSKQPVTGYQLKQFVDGSSRHFWHAQTSQIYRTLNALETAGLLTSEIQEQDVRPDRRIYQITAAGQADLQAWLAEPMTEIAPTKDALLVRIFFSAQLDKATVLTQLRLQRSLHQRQLNLYQNEIADLISTQVQQNSALKRDGLLWEITRRNGELAEEAYVRWLDEAIERIEIEF